MTDNFLQLIYEEQTKADKVILQWKMSRGSNGLKNNKINFSSHQRDLRICTKRDLFPLNFSLFSLGQRRLLIEHRMHLTSHSPHLQMTPNPSHPSRADLSRFILRSCIRPKNVRLVRVFMFHSFNVKGANGQEVHRRTRDLHFSLAFSLVVKSDGDDMQIWATNKWKTIV